MQVACAMSSAPLITPSIHGPPSSSAHGVRRGVNLEGGHACGCLVHNAAGSSLSCSLLLRPVLPWRDVGCAWFIVLCILRSLRLVACRAVYLTVDSSDWAQHHPPLLSIIRECMYIPLSPRASPPSAVHVRSGDAVRQLHHAGSRDALSSSPSDRLLAGRTLVSRQFSDNAVQNANIRTGVIVGVVLAIFLIGVLAFFWFFRFSIRFSYRKKRRHRHKPGSSKSSKSSEGGAPPDGGAEAPPE